MILGVLGKGGGAGGESEGGPVCVFLAEEENGVIKRLKTRQP